MADNLVLIIETKQITVIQDSRSISDEKNVDDVKECGKTRVRQALPCQITAMLQAENGLLWLDIRVDRRSRTCEKKTNTSNF